ncbi:MAG: SDR family oxidoreductase [Bacteroidales bacterium]|nr:SDR family oxidoreductase [Bacteroidales bacterium]
MNIVITGAGKGIGFELAKLFANNSNNKIVAISRDISKLTNLKIEGKLFPVSYNLENLLHGDLQLIERINLLIGNIDILINNAGLLIKEDFENINIVEARRIFDINYFVPAILIKELLPFFSKEGKPHIVNIGSMGGFQGSSKFKGLSIYSSSKSAIAALSECLAEELKETGISCNCLALGSAQTEMFNTAFPGLKASCQAADMAAEILKFSLEGHLNNNGKVIPMVFGDF